MPSNKKLKEYDEVHERETYDKNFYEKHECYYKKAVTNFTNYMLENFEFDSICDIGCGTGEFLSQLQGTKDVLGIDFSVGASECLVLDRAKYLDADVTKPLNLNRTFDVVVSLEVFEHIFKELEDVYLDNIDSLSPKYLILSCAVPRQWGRHHVNPREPEYVIETLLKRGYEVDVERTEKFKCIKKLAAFYRKNTHVFHKKQQTV